MIVFLTSRYMAYVCVRMLLIPCRRYYPSAARFRSNRLSPMEFPHFDSHFVRLYNLIGLL